MAKKKLDCILVVDLEATCWVGGPPEGQESEIIEIGLCVLHVSSGLAIYFLFSNLFAMMFQFALQKMNPELAAKRRAAARKKS